MWLLPKLSSPLSTVTADSLKLQGNPVFSSHYGKPAWSYIWNLLSEKTKEQEVKLPTWSFPQLLLNLPDATIKDPLYRARSGGVKTINNSTYPSENGVSVLLHMKSGNVSVPQFCLNLENPTATNMVFTLAWNGNLPESKSIRGLGAQFMAVEDVGRQIQLFPLCTAIRDPHEKLTTSTGRKSREVLSEQRSYLVLIDNIQLRHQRRAWPVRASPRKPSDNTGREGL